MVDVPPGFQPAGRAPAPPPLNLVQDFVNTEIAVWAVDDIATPDAFASWLEQRGLLRAGALVDPAVFVRARALRDVLRRLARRNTRALVPDEGLHSAFAVIAAELQPRFHIEEDGAVRIVGADDAAGALVEIVARVHAAQAAGTWRRLKTCPGPHCGWLFYDASRNASSTWCSMSICGNRTKTAAYRRRRRSSA